MKGILVSEQEGSNMRISFPIRWLGVIIAAAALAGCSSPLASTVEWHLKVQGTVTDAATGAPLVDVTVRFSSGLDYVGTAAYTDAAGNYLVTMTWRSDIAPGLSFFQGGYSGFTLYDRVICSDNLQTINVEMNKVTY
jgi:hypothetical protein